MSVSVNYFPISYSSSTYYNLFRGFVKNEIILECSGYSVNDNYRIEYRFCVSSTDQDNQNAVNILSPTTFEYYPDSDGLVKIDLSIMAKLMNPSLNSSSGIMSSLIKVFQVQYREVTDSTTGSWVSIHDDDLPAFKPFVLIHAGGNTAKFSNTFGILNNTKRLFKNYTNDILFYSTEANKDSETNLKIRYKTPSKANYRTSDFALPPFNGICKLPISQTFLNEQGSRYLVVESSDGNTIYSTHTIYNTNQGENEFHLRWLGSDGDTKSWVFTKTAKLETSIDMIFNEREFRQIPKDIEEAFILESDGLSKTEYDYIKDLNESNYIVMTHNGEEFMAIISDPSFEEDTYSNTKSIKFTAIKFKKYLLNA